MENVSFYFCIAKLYAKFTLPSLKIFFLSENFWFPVEPLVDKKKKKKTKLDERMKQSLGKERKTKKSRMNEKEKE